MIRGAHARRSSRPPSQPLLALALLLLTAAAFWQVLDNSFVNYDDEVYVTQNRPVQSGLTAQSLRWAFTTFHTGNWHPLTWISHMLDCQLFDLNPKGHHLTSLLFHLANTLLLFTALTRMTGAPWPSAFAALLFGIHPVHVESVAWVAERKDVLSTFFWMLTMLAYRRYVQRPQTGNYLLVGLCLALGLMSKPMLVTLPFVLLLLDYWPLRRLAAENGKRANPGAAARRLILEKLPFFALALASSVVTFFAQRAGGAVDSLDHLPLPARISNALESYVRYIAMMVWPDNLAVLYPHPRTSLPFLLAAGSFLLLASATFLAIRSARKKPYLPVGWLWYLGTLVPVIGLVQIGAQARADRYTYVPLIGLFVIVAWGVPDLLAQWRHRRLGFRVAAGIVTAALVIVTRFQVGHWRDNFSLFAQQVRATPDNPVAHNTLGAEFLLRGRTEEARFHFSKAVLLNPGYSKARYNLGLLLSQQGKTEEAIDHYQEALRIEPDYAKAHLNLGVALARQGQFGEAFEHYRRAAQLQPDYPEAHLNLGIELARQGRLNQAVEHFTQAARIKPDFAQAHYQLARAYLALRDSDAAQSEYVKVQALNPGLADNLRTLMGR
ncbi:MAG: tetratricopeptide repeat protein [Acidobacteria bacterium]|nr:tetratricopeptide repeat protein [Acidobacteriota bacterium]